MVTGQTVYKVPGDSKGNRIQLVVANESSVISAQSLTVGLSGVYRDVTVTPSIVKVKLLAPGATTEVSFGFDVSREAKPNSRDTLLFDVKDNTGNSWSKSVILEFAGPQEFALAQNYPNPFNPSTTIEFDLPVAARTSIAIYDILGREVTKLVDEPKETGYHSVVFDAHSVASGAYIYRMIAQPISGGKAFTKVKKLLVVR
jgi:hypothetical protein